MTQQGHWCPNHKRAEATEVCCEHRWATLATDEDLKVCRACFGAPATGSVARSRSDDPRNETELTPWVVKEAQNRGWLAFHPRPAWTGKGYRTAMMGDKGFPDLVLAHPLYGVVFAELKSKGAYPDEQQRDWGDVLVDVARRTVMRTLVPSRQAADGRRMVQYHVWRPADRAAILQVLDGRPPEGAAVSGSSASG